MKIAIYNNSASGAQMEICSGKMLLFDGMRAGMRTIKLRGRRPDCAVCGDEPSVKRLIDYEEFCGARACDKAAHLRILHDHERITVHEYHSILSDAEPHVLLDVRQRLQFDICSLPNSINIPLEELPARIAEVKECLLDKDRGESKAMPLFIVCRRGNRSQKAVRILQSHGMAGTIKDILGGVTAWHHEINQEFPLY
jgi:adenylyltransferase/sulfurtransferase